MELLRYFQENENSLRIINGSTGDAKAKQRIWIELAHRLNTMTGTMKSTAKWAKYWNDIVFYTKNRAQQTLLGTKPIKHPNEFDKKMLTLIGHDDLLKQWLHKAKQYSIKLEDNNSEASDFDENIENVNYQLDVPLESPNKNFLNTVRAVVVSKRDSIQTRSGGAENQMTTKRLSVSSQDKITENDDVEVSNPPPAKKIAIEDNSSQNNFKKEFAEALAEFPKALSNISEGFQILSSAIEKMAKALEKYIEK